MNTVLTIGLLVVSNIFMTCAWYGHLKLQDMKLITDATPLWVIVLFSWGLALLEYCFMIPANRIGFQGNGGPFSLMQLKVIQEVVSLVIFTIISVQIFKIGTLQWNHVAAFFCLVAAVYFIFMK